MNKMVVSMLFVIGALVIGCGKESPTMPSNNDQSVWVPTADNLSAYSHQKRLFVTDVTGTHYFWIDVGGRDSSLVNRLGPDYFRLEVLSLNSAEYEGGGPECGVGIDGRRPAQDQLHTDYQPTDPPPLGFKIKSAAGELPEHLRLTLLQLPVTDYAAMVEGGQYRSVTLRRNGSGPSDVQFFHHHGDGNVHLLYHGQFNHCTYAYDSAADHGLSAWRTNRGDEAVELRADWYGRCH